MPDIPNRDELERKLARELGKLQRNQLMRLLEHLGEPPNINNVPPEFWDEVGKDLARVIAPFLENVYLEQAKLVMDAQPIGIDWALVNEAAVEWANGYTFKLVGDITNTTKQALGRAVSAYFQRGQTRGELEKAISGIFGATRAEGIAVTEITRAAAEGEVVIGGELSKVGVDMIAYWNTNNDELVCPICRPLNNRPADGYDSGHRPFWIHPKSGKKYDIPPDAHPRDRCWMRWELPKRVR